MFTVPHRKPAVDAWSETAFPDTIHDIAIIRFLAFKNQLLSNIHLFITQSFG